MNECPLCLASNDPNARFCQFCGANLKGGVIQSSTPQNREIQPYQTTSDSNTRPTTYQQQPQTVVIRQRSFFHDFFLFMFLWQIFRWIGIFIAVLLGGGMRGGGGQWR